MGSFTVTTASARATQRRSLYRHAASAGDGTRAHVVRLQDDVDHVVHHPSGTAGAPGPGRQVQGDGDGQDAERVVEIGRRQVRPEGGPPAANMDGPGSAA